MLLFVGSAVASNSGLGDLRNATGATNGPTTIGQVTSPSIGIINGNSTYSKTTNNTAYTAYFKTDSDTSKAIVFQTRGYSESIDISTSQFHYAASSSLNYAIIGMTTNMNPAHTTISVSGPNATYTGAFVNTNLLFNAQAGELKETLTTTAIFPSSNPGLTAYLEYAENVYYTNTMTIYANHVAYHQVSGQFITTQGRVDFNTTPDNTTIFYLPSPVVKDSSGGSVLGTYRVNVNNGILVVNILVPIAWVNTAVFPIHIDPSTVSTTTATQPITNGGGNNQIIFAQSLWWVFYHSGTNFVFRTSSDGTTWSAASTLRSGTGTSQQGKGLGLEFSGSKFCYAILSSTTTKELVRCGTLNGGGTITLYSSEQTVTFSAACACNSGGSYVAIGNDSSNNIWLEMFEKPSGYQEEIFEGTSCGSSCTWASADILSGDGNGAQVVMNLGSTEMAFTFASSGSSNGNECVLTWSGSAFNTVHCTADTLGTGNGGATGAVNVGTTVYIAGSVNTANAPVEFYSCSYPCSSVTGDGQIASLSEEQGWVNLATDGAGTFVVTYDDHAAPTTTVDYTSCTTTCTTNTNWSGTTTLTSGETSINNQNGVGTSTINNGCAAVAWRAGTSSPYNLRFSTVLTCSGGGVTTTLSFSPSVALSAGFAQSVTVTNSPTGTPADAITLSTVVSEKNSGDVTATDYQSKVWYVVGLYWAFYLNDNYTVPGPGFSYKTSSTGLPGSWSAATQISPHSVDSLQFDATVSGTTFYYVETPDSSYSYFTWRYGTMTGAGTITWSIASTNVATAAGAKYPSIELDTTGNVWVAMNIDNTPDHLEAYEFSGGVWTNKLDTTLPSSTTVFSHIMRLPTGEMALVYVVAGAGVSNTYITSWSGSAWSTPSQPASSYGIFGSWDSQTIGSTAYFVGLPYNGTGYSGIKFWTSTYPFASVSAETTLSTTAFGDPILTTDGGSTFLMAYATTKTTIVYRTSTNTGSTWSGESTLTTGAQLDAATGYLQLSSNDRTNSGTAYMEWINSAAQPDCSAGGDLCPITFATVTPNAPTPGGISISATFQQTVTPATSPTVSISPTFGLTNSAAFSPSVTATATFNQQVTPNPFAAGITLTPIFSAGVVPVVTFTASMTLGATFNQQVTPNLGSAGLTLTPFFVGVPCIGCGGGSTTTITTTSTVTSGNTTTTVTTTPGQIIGGNENDPLVPFLVVLCFIVILVAAVLVRRRNVVNSRYLESG